MALHQALFLPQDDLFAVTQMFINEAVSRSGLDRCCVATGPRLIPHEEGPKVLRSSNSH